MTDREQTRRDHDVCIAARVCRCGDVVETPIEGCPPPGAYAFCWRVRGTVRRLGGNMTFRYENEGTTMADSLPEAILRLVNRDLGWDTLDFDAPIDIEIALDSDD